MRGPRGEMRCKAPEIDGLADLWALTRGASDVRIAILDGPVDLSHSCFQGAGYLASSQFLHPTTHSHRDHGTHVASIIIGQPGSLVEGIAPHCTAILLPIFGEGQDGTLVPCSQADLARAIWQALDAKADVINISA